MTSNVAPLWSHLYGTPATQEFSSVSCESDGQCAASGVFASSIDFGGGAYAQSPGGSDGFLVWLSP